jgi:hypothetical protein
MAVGVLKELRERGIRVPDDISVTGFDNIKLSEFCYPALTTVHIPRDRIGHTLFTSLAPDSSSAKTLGKEIVIDPEFVVRDSTGPANRAHVHAVQQVRGTVKANPCMPILSQPSAWLDGHEPRLRQVL